MLRFFADGDVVTRRQTPNISSRLVHTDEEGDFVATGSNDIRAFPEEIINGVVFLDVIWQPNYYVNRTKESVGSQ